MLWKTLTAVLLLLSAGLIGSHLHLVRAANSWIEDRRDLEEERASLVQQQAELATLMAQLGQRVEASPARQEQEDATRTVAARSETFDTEGVWKEVALEPFHERPDPIAIEPLSADDLEALREARRAMPAQLSDSVLLQGDVDAVLGDPEWNPGRRELSAEERSELAVLLSDYRYFARLSIFERTQTMVRPEVGRLRELGAFVEYPEDTAPPTVDGIKISHSEPSDRPGYRRIDYFPPEDYAELYHQKRVEEERSLETFVMIYRLINRRG